MSVTNTLLKLCHVFVSAIHVYNSFLSEQIRLYSLTLGFRIVYDHHGRSRVIAGGSGGGKIGLIVTQ